MIRVTIDVIPDGVEEEAYNVHTIEIVDTQPDYGNSVHEIYVNHSPNPIEFMADSTGVLTKVKRVFEIVGTHDI